MLYFSKCNAPGGRHCQCQDDAHGAREPGVHSGETLFVRGADCSVRSPAHILPRAVRSMRLRAQQCRVTQESLMAFTMKKHILQTLLLGATSALASACTPQAKPPPPKPAVTVVDLHA